MENMFGNMFGKLKPGMCRLSMNGGVAVHTSSGYKSYNVKTNKLTNCSNFVFDIGEEFFFVIPTNKVEVGDIILVNKTPKCVIEVSKKEIKVLSYEDSTIQTILPERHIFMGETYFYGKIVSMFGPNFLKGKKGMNKMMSYMMMSEVMKGMSGGSTSGNSMLPLMLMGGGNFGNMFEGLFSFDNDEEEDGDEEENDESFDNTDTGTETEDK